MISAYYLGKIHGLFLVARIEILVLFYDLLANIFDEHLDVAYHCDLVVVFSKNAILYCSSTGDMAKMHQICLNI